MPIRQLPRAPKSPERQAFERYLRYGMLAYGEILEEKHGYNPYRADDGRFDFGPGQGTLPPREDRAAMGAGSGLGNKRPAISARPRGPATLQRKPAARVTIGDLSAKHETGGGDPGTVSTGTNDPGGISCGKHQYSSAKGIAAQFVRSPEARRWASDFQGLRPGTQAFSEKWKDIARRDRVAFSAAQDAFTGKTHYDAAVQRVARSTGLDLTNKSEALRQVTFSVAVQHGVPL